MLREWRPPFSPATVIGECCAEIRRYGVAFVVGDRYGAELVAEQFRAKGIGYRPSEKSKSDLYLEALPLMNSGLVKLLDHPRLIGQLANLERSTARGGRSTVDHPRGGHDDLSNAASGALVLAAGHRAPELIWTGIPLAGGRAAQAEREALREIGGLPSIDDPGRNHRAPRARESQTTQAFNPTQPKQ